MSIHSLLTSFKHLYPDTPDACILNKADATAQFGNTTFGDPTPIDGAITLSDTQQMGSILSLANQFNIVVCPISSGNNWGYGSVHPSDSRPLLVVNLNQLKAIKAIDKTSGLISIEPGVTQGQLTEYLEQHDWPFMTPVTGAGPNCSLLSNALERGYGPNPHTDHFSGISSLRYYIAHPEHCHQEHYSAITSLDGHKNKDCECETHCNCSVGQSVVDATHKWALGPYIDGLFTQSNLGIVSRATLKLAPKPEAFCSFFIKCQTESTFQQAVDFIKQLHIAKQGELGIVSLMDKGRVISMVVDNPNPDTPSSLMTTEQVERIAKTYDIADWTIMGSIYATKDSLNATKKYIKQHANFAADILFSDSIKIPIARFVTRFIMKERKAQLDALPLGINLMLGKPNRVGLKLAYWRNTHAVSDIQTDLRPDKDRCGVLWYSPLVPMNAVAMAEFVEFIRQTTPQFDIEPFITFQNLSYDCVDSTIPILFDLTDPDAVKKAHQCLNTLFDEGLKRGFVPYRLNTQQQQTKLDPAAPHWQVTQLIKQALDPNNVINPHRYNPKP